MPCLSLASPIHLLLSLPKPIISCSDLAISLLSYYHIPQSISLPMVASSTILYNFLPSHYLLKSSYPHTASPYSALPAQPSPPIQISQHIFPSLTFEEIHLACPNLPPNPSYLLPYVIFPLLCLAITYPFNIIVHHTIAPQTPTFAYIHFISHILPYPTIPFPT